MTHPAQELIKQLKSVNKTNQFEVLRLYGKAARFCGENPDCEGREEIIDLASTLQSDLIAYQVFRDLGEDIKETNPSLANTYAMLLLNAHKVIYQHFASVNS